MNIHTIFECIAINNNTKCLICNNENITYKELNKKSNQLANYLKLNNEEFVALIMDPSIESIIAILAVLKSGGTYVPILPSFPSDRINYILDNISATKIITNGNYFDFTEINIDLQKFNYDAYDHNNLNLNIPFTNLAYVIYTPGSTGRPKGVMVQHDSVINVCQDLQKNLQDQRKKHM
jgi:non-ribosomal peptide synthetase component F